MLLRVLVVVLALGAAAVLVPRLADDRACDGARRDAFGLALGAAGDGRAIADRALAHCTDPAALAPVALALQRGRAGGEATRVARTATERYPASFDAWAALERVAGDEAAGRRARALAPRPR